MRGARVGLREGPGCQRGTVRCGGKGPGAAAVVAAAASCLLVRAEGLSTEVEILLLDPQIVEGDCQHRHTIGWRPAVGPLQQPLAGEAAPPAEFELPHQTRQERMSVMPGVEGFASDRDGEVDGDAAGGGEGKKGEGGVEAARAAAQTRSKARMR